MDYRLEQLNNDQTKEKIAQDGLENTKRYNWDVRVKKLIDVHLEYQNSG